MPQKVSEYRKAFQRKKNEPEADAKTRMESRIEQLLKEGKLVKD
jgi:hypothetical protein